MAILLALYLVIAFYYFKYWRKAFRRDTNLSKQEKRFSWLVLAVATIFWPIVVPISQQVVYHRTQKLLATRRMSF
ncbi:MAG: hypothetical protein WA919_06985 [Coleofasciculaceae cyanobacterium]